MKHHGSTLVPGRQVHGGDGPDALTVQDNVLWADAIPGYEHKIQRNIMMQVTGQIQQQRWRKYSDALLK